MLSAAAKAAESVLPGPGSGLGSKGDEREYRDEELLWIEPVYGTSLAINPAPSEMPEGSMAPYCAKQIVVDMLQFNQPPRLNLCSFLNTWMEPEALEIINQTLHVNMADAVQYPANETMENRCIRMLAKLWNSPTDNFQGTGCVGSSEACYLAGLAMKKNWQARMRKQGLPTTSPNLVFGHNAQVAWQKFCSFFDVEPRYIEVREGQLVLDPSKLREVVDANTIGVAAMFASTYNGQYEDVEAIDKELEHIWQEKGWEVPLHVDAANGGMIAPMLQPELAWDFRLKHVVSINVSGHKYGLTFPGCAFIVWRDKEYVPQDMIFTVDYLGKEESSLTINFSRPGSMIAAQYYNFIRLGKDGFRRVFHNLMRVYDFLRRQLEDTGHFEILSTGDVPVMAFRLKPGRDWGFDEFDLMHRLKEHQWMVPAYKMAPQATHIKLLRVCIRIGFDLEMCINLVNDIQKALKWLDEHYGQGQVKGGQVSQQSKQGEDKQRAQPC